jgi:hypothetical protein
VDADQQLRDRHLDRIGSWIAQNGLAALATAKAEDVAGVSEDELCEFFASREDVVAALVARGRKLHREKLSLLLTNPSMTNTERMRAMWEHYVESEDDMRLFFEAYGIALHDKDYGRFIFGIEDWFALIDPELERQGMSRGNADAYATLVIAVIRGAMMDLCATGNRARVKAAMEMWFAASELLEKNLT